MALLDRIVWAILFYAVVAAMAGGAFEAFQLYRLNHTTRYKIWAIVKLAIAAGVMLRFTHSLGLRFVGDIVFLIGLGLFGIKVPKLKPGEQPLPAHEWRVRRIPVSEQRAYKVGTVSKPRPRNEL